MQKGLTMFTRIMSAAIVGMDVIPVQVEADVSDGLPHFTMVGFVSSQVKEAGDRVRTALKNIGSALPPKRITINLSPADVPKSGSGFDLPVALGMLAAMEIFSPESLTGIMAVGELSLSGEINPVAGILPSAMKAREIGVSTMLVPRANLGEARLVDGLTVIGCASLPEVIDFLRDGVLPEDRLSREEQEINSYTVDFSEIRGQDGVKRAAAISAAGFHNLLMIGPPGSGKTMIAKRIPTIMPPLTRDESLDITKIYSIAGLLSPDSPIMGTRPFRSPHHTMSPQALAGGGRIPKPGEITLAHRGILFLDEMPEFSRGSLEILRQPLEDREIIIARQAGTFRFPADFLLLAAMNPCPCGYFPDRSRCKCTPLEINSYLNRISQPLLDRIDLCVECPAVSIDELTPVTPSGRSSHEIRKEVMKAAAIQKARYQNTGFHFNSEIPSSRIGEFCPMEESAGIFLRKAYDRLGLTARSYFRIIRVARTIADLAGSDLILKEHVSEAVSYRTVDKKYRAV